MTTLKFTSNYHQNLRILLKAGYDLATANHVAARVKRLKDSEEKKKFIREINEELQSLGLH